MNNSIQTSIAPWLSVHDITKAVAFYKTAFGAVETYRLESPDGALMVAKLSIDEAAFWLSEEPSEQGTLASRPSNEASPVRMILTVAAPDIIFDQAMAAGASEVFPVGEQHGWRLGRLVDPFGHHWEIGHQLD